MHLMERTLLEVSVGTVIAGGFLLVYIKKVKNRLRGRILRDYTCK